MRALRLLHVTPYYEGARGYGGVPRAAAGMCRGLAARGHAVTVCTTDARDGAGRLAGGDRTEAGVRVSTFPNVSNRLAYGRQLFLPRGMRAFLARSAPLHDLVHIHGHHHVPGVLAARALAGDRVPYVVSPHGLAHRAEGQRLAKWAFDVTVGRDVLPGAARIIAVSDVERRQLVGLGIAEDRLRLVGNPLDLEDLAAPAGPSLQERFGHERVVLYLGTLLPQKCVDVLVRALPLLRTPGVGLLIAGNDLGAEARVRAAIAELGLAGRVRLLGLVAGRERAALLAGADVVAYAGRGEALGLVPLEALVCGTPVVVGDSSGSAALVAELGGGLGVPPGEPAPLAAALDEVLAAPARWRAEAAAAGRVLRARCSYDAVAAALEGVYRDVLDRRGAA